MIDQIKTTIPGSFADLMSQSPPPSTHKLDKSGQKTKRPAKFLPKNPIKEAQGSQMLQQYPENFPLSRQETNGVTHGVMTSPLREVTYRVWKDMIENSETHNSSLRLTNEENYAVEDMINELKRSLKVKSSLNEVARLGLLYVIHDFIQNRENSLVYKVKKS